MFIYEKGKSYILFGKNAGISLSAVKTKDLIKINNCVHIKCILFLYANVLVTYTANDIKYGHYV